CSAPTPAGFISSTGWTGVACRPANWCSGTERVFRACLLIPVYNHGPLIEATLARLAPFGLPCLLVDDGSEATTAAVLDAIAARDPSVRLFRLPRNSGKGAAVLHGIAQARQLGY